MPYEAEYFYILFTHLIDEFNPLTFIMIIDIVGFIHTSYLWFWLPHLKDHLCYFTFPPSCIFWLEFYIPILCTGFEDRSCISHVLMVILNCLHAYFGMSVYYHKHILTIKHYEDIYIYTFFPIY